MHFLTSIKAKAISAGLLPKRHKKPPKPEPNILPPLIPTELPHILPEHSFALSDQGWTKLTFDRPVDPLQTSSQALFEASKVFFDLPAEKKHEFKTRAGTEEGWNHVPGEKEFITLRSLERVPMELRDAASAFWDVAGGLLDDLVRRVAESLGLPPDALGVYSEPCRKLGVEKTATLLRLFRYESSSSETEMKTVAEAHRDLGLISLVIGDTPGLEVWNRTSQYWFSIEKTFSEPAGSLMVGRQLERLSNSRYQSGGHRVVSYPAPTLDSQSKTTRRYRYSIVFVLRAHEPVPVSTDQLTTKITGTFANTISGTAGELYREIHRAHFNINTGIEERNRQREVLAARKGQEEQLNLKA
ncbi:hypothetical protein HYFRA_00009537 [Hymenoscyphus fraxineus]|uniref:Isopenicillin N synthase-like Fe(2+) 2OG dioxygenase domain-containing protein n=1 Tax=Hymenoscyphus fraxineus TaxID=746836 RepID=A0A9N9PUG0_9HELO|nr:hypothetical protein HYFRA_00009537 [Hymenoscyphus fraxineus]